MQYLLISKSDTLLSISTTMGQQNVDLLLAENSLKRTPRIGQTWYDKCQEIIANTPNDVTAARKASLLNGLVGSEEVFEKACLMDEDEWKVFSNCQAFKDALRVPESIVLPYSTQVIGNVGVGNQVVLGQGAQQTVNRVSPITYKAVMKGLQNSGSIDPAIFNTVNSAPAATINRTVNTDFKVSQYAFNIPWGKIQIYSSLLDEVIDIPAYPETVNKSRKATYVAMPDTIYQYEPWITYESSGPREQELTFHLHRDMWTGNHLDGNADKLIKFCEANTFPRYSGSMVLAPTVKIYINGKTFISGVLVSTSVDWSGPLGQDGWYLEFSLSVSLQEVSERRLSIDTVYGG